MSRKILLKNINDRPRVCRPAIIPNGNGVLSRGMTASGQNGNPVRLLTGGRSVGFTDQDLIVIKRCIFLAHFQQGQ